MARRLAFAIAVGLALGGCCHDIGAHLPPSNARAEFGILSNPSHVKRVRSRHTGNTAASSIPPSEDQLSKLDSKEWSADQEQIADDELRKKLVICRGCEQPATEDQVSAVWPTRAAEGYLSIQKTLRSLSLPEATLSSGSR
jgi:hypothetical protein